MFYLDTMGNQLSNLKLSFYEARDEKNFISKMYQESYESNYREILIRSYMIVREIYDDIATPVRQKQIRSRELMECDRRKAMSIGHVVSSGKPFEETICNYTNL